MKKTFSKRLLALLCAAALMAGMVPAMAAQDETATLAAAEHTLWIVGDSTACDYAASEDAKLFYKRMGFGTALKEYVGGDYEVKNLALSGDSSKSFLTKSNYTTLESGIKAGDVLIIAFGHNDQKQDAEHYTNPNGGKSVEGSFAKSLYDNYVKLAKDANAFPILCTPIVRRSDKNDYSGERGHNPPGNDAYPGGNYPQVIKDLAAGENVPVVDMTTLTKDKYIEVGVSESQYFHAWSRGKTPDNTHLNAYGAHVVAQILATELKKLTAAQAGGLAAAVDPAAVTPDKETHLVQNPDWTDPAEDTYAPPTTQSTQCEPYVLEDATFYGTAMGDLGGKATAANHIREKTAGGDMRIAALNNKGKISSAADGIVMYYYAVPAGKPFTLRSKATVSAIDANNQVAFGLMARDDMYIDKTLKDDDDPLAGLASEYVTAGCRGDGSGVNYARHNEALVTNTGVTLAKPLAAGQSYKLEIVRSADGNYACAMDGKSKTYDYSIDLIDGEYTYVGMFCSRNADVTYSDIYLEVDGVVLCGSTLGNDDPVEPSTTPSTTPSTEPSTAPTTPPVPVTGAVAGGGFESLFAELPGVSDADVTAVKWSGTMSGELTGEDLEYLVRDAQGGVRIDIPGLKAGEYDLTVTVSGKDYVAKGLTVSAYDRSGFAHWSYTDEETMTGGAKYTEGVGAYNDDGTLKDNALVVYVTDDNKNTVSVEFNRGSDKKTVTGIGNILNSNNSKVNQGFLEYWSREYKRPLVVRFLGTVNAPEGVSQFKAGSSNGSMVYMLSGANITLEGVGPDATIYGWGISFGADKDDTQYNKQARNFEVRNLSFKEVPEDCLEITGFEGENGSIQESVEHSWVHNCAFYRPSDIANPAETDKVQGDGAMDFKSGRYMTMSYNYFERNHKTSLVGGGDTQKQYHVTWHHNYWKDVESRAPLGRQADMHIYNNLYENQSSYCMSLRGNMYAFSEYNTFLNCKNPVKLEASSNSTEPVGACKSYMDDFSTSTGTNQATIATSKTQQVDSTNKYPNFDTNPESYIAKGQYTLDTSVETAQANIKANGGVMKAAAQMTTKPLQVEAEVEPSATPSVTPTPSGSGSSGGGGGGSSSTPKPTPTPTPAASATPEEEKPVTTVTTDDAGNTIETTVASDGSKAEKVTTPEGDVTLTAVDANGETQVNIKLPAAIPAPEVKFVDVPEEHWATSAINNMAALGVVEGVDKENHIFDMHSGVTRGSVATILFRFSNGEEGKGNSFDDVAENIWYTDAVGWAVNAGVVTGYSQTAFGPNDIVTREQMAAMLARYAKLIGLDTTADAAVLNAFVDGESTGSWAVNGMAWCVEQGILQGRGGDVLDPSAPVTRMEATAMLERMVGLIRK